jgi:uncharacterized protein
MTIDTTVTDIESLHDALGGTGAAAEDKIFDRLETHSMRWIRSSVLTAVASIDPDDQPRIDVLAGTACVADVGVRGFVLVVDADHPLVARSQRDDRVGLLFFVPPLEETLRVNGRVESIAVDSSSARLTVVVRQMYLHCAKALKRADLWNRIASRSNASSSPEPLGDGAFALLATVSPAGEADLSPRGDPPGTLIRPLADGRLAMGDRPGNKLADSFHNLIEHPRAAIAVLDTATGSLTEVVGTVELSTDTALRDTCAVNGRVPRLVSVITVMETRVGSIIGGPASNLFDVSTWTDPTTWPSFGRMLADQILGFDSADANDAVPEFDREVDEDYRTAMY